jgi:hypothetical protein
MDPLAKAYLKVITESSDDLQNKDQKVKGYTPKEGEAFGDDTNAKKLQPKSGPDSDGAETPESPQEAKGNLSVGKETNGAPKKFEKNYAESKNPFDVLFNKIISEEGEMMDFATSENPADSTFEPSLEGDSEDGMGEDEGESEQVTITLDKEMARALVDALQAVLESEEGEEEMGEFGEGESDEADFGSNEGDDEESSQNGALPFGEAVESEECGHALVDAEKLNHGLNAKGSYTVKGAVPVTKKSAQTPSTGKGHDGKLKAHNTQAGVSKLTSKGSVDTKLVKVGKTIFDND